MTSPSRRLILTVSLLALASLLTSHVSTAQTGVTWTSLTGATTSGSGLTPTAAGGRGESSQSIPAGNGTLKVIAWSSGNGEFVSFGLTNVATFTGATTEIDYGWRSYGSAANCRKDGDSLNGFINITNGDSLEVRINGTSVEYYHNSTLVTDCTLTNQTLSYPYRAAATFTASSAPPISSATMTGMDNLVPPTTLAATNGSGNSINLSWAYAGAGQSGFKIERKLGKTSTYAEIAAVGASTLTYSDTGSKTANRVYAYRVRAYKTGENGPYSAFAQATTPYTGGGGIKTDRAVYAEPTLPPLPHAGGKWRDEVFGTEIMRASDDDDCGGTGAGTWYNQWPTFNSDNTRILMRCGTSGDMIIKCFDPVNFKLGTTLRKTWGGGATQTPMIGGEYARWQGATWSRTDPDKIWVVPMAPNEGGSTTRGPQIYTYSVSANEYTPVKSFVSLFTSSQVFFEYHFAGTASDGDYDVFTASVIPEQNDEAARWFAWQRTGDRVVFNFDNANVTHYNVCVPTKGGDYIYCGPDFGYTTRKIYRVSDLAEQDISTTPAISHGDVGTVWNVARNVQGTLSPQERRTTSDWNNTALTIFDWEDAYGVQDSSNDCHTSLAADNEDWVMQGCHDEPSANTPEEAWRETNAFEDEIMQIATDGSQRIRRLVHHRSVVSSSSDYWAAPKPTISLDGRFIAFTSDWEDSGRTDLFILRVPSQGSSDMVWVEDALPTGAQGYGNYEGWSWVSSNPAPHSGASAHQSVVRGGFHNHYFTSATETLAVGAGDRLYAYVYIDPANVPSELMLQWYDGTAWKNAYWGTDSINWIGTRLRVGDLPTAGQWVRLEVPAAALGLEGKTLTGMAFNQWDGRATWDRAGKAVWPETVWVEDALPAGAQGYGNYDSWSWVGSSPAPHSGASAHQSVSRSGFHNHYFMSATETLSVGMGDKLFAYAYLDPQNMPTELMLQWYDGSAWRNAYWGADSINWIGTRVRVGDLPASGQWVRLEVPAATLGLEGKTLSGMAFNQWDGRATWDRAGRSQ